MSEQPTATRRSRRYVLTNVDTARGLVWHLDEYRKSKHRNREWWNVWVFRRRHLAVQFAARRGIRIEPNQESR